MLRDKPRSVNEDAAPASEECQSAFETKIEIATIEIEMVALKNVIGSLSRLTKFTTDDESLRINLQSHRTTCG